MTRELHEVSSSSSPRRGKSPTRRTASPGSVKGSGKDGRVTLRDVARVAGVSVKTASNVLNNDGRMAPETRRSVQRIINKLGYKRNAAASNLKRGLTRNLTLALPTLSAPYLAELAEAVIASARRHGYTVFVRTYTAGTSNDARALIHSFNDSMSDGLIVSLDELTHFVPHDFEVDYPIVALGSRDTFNTIDHIETDDVANAAQALHFLLERGARRIAVIGAHHAFDPASLRLVNEGNAELRLRGVIEEADREQWTPDPRLVPTTGYEWTIGNGYELVQRLTHRGTFDAVLALNDSLAIGALSALETAGLSVPDDVQVMGFDDIHESRYLHPALTTVGSQIDWISETAVTRLLGQIKGSVTAPATLMTTSSIIERDTTLPRVDHTAH